MEQERKEFLRPLAPLELAKLYEEEMKSTFPPEELKPLSSMEDMRARGCYQPLGMFDGSGVLEGYALMWTGEAEEYPLIDYLGVPAAQRGRGTGTRMLALVGEHFAHAKGILAEAEAEESGNPAGKELRRRRLGFYARCGFVTLPYECALFGVHYKVLMLPHGPVDADAALKEHQALYRMQFRPERLEQYIQLPLKEGEKVKEFAPWTEG